MAGWLFAGLLLSAALAGCERQRPTSATHVAAAPQPAREGSARPAPRSSGPTQVAAGKPAPKAPAANTASADKPGLIGRIGRGLKSLVTRGPRSQH